MRRCCGSVTPTTGLPFCISERSAVSSLARTETVGTSACITSSTGVSGPRSFNALTMASRVSTPRRRLDRRQSEIPSESWGSRPRPRRRRRRRRTGQRCRNRHGNDKSMLNWHSGGRTCSDWLIPVRKTVMLSYSHTAIAASNLSAARSGNILAAFEILLHIFDADFPIANFVSVELMTIVAGDLLGVPLYVWHQSRE
jgi:hypothetical protein